MKTITGCIAAAAAGAALAIALGLAPPRPAVGAPADDRLAREQVQALKDIASELREMRRECGR